MTNPIDPRMLTRLSQAEFDRVITGNPPRAAADGTVYSGAVRLSWPNLAKPGKPMKPGDTPKYGASGLFLHKNIGIIMDALKSAVRLHYPSVTDPALFLNPRDKNHPVKDQGLKVSVADGGFDPIKSTTGGYVPGFPFCSAKSMRAVRCFHSVAGRNVEAFGEDIEKLFYPGCWVVLALKILKSSTAQNPGVFFGLQGVIKIGDDTPFGGGGASAEDFDGVVTIENPNETAILQNTAVGANANDWG